MTKKQRLELTWYNKDQALIPAENGKYGYTWVDASDPRYCETHTVVYDERVVGRKTSKSDAFQYSERADLEPQEDNLLVLGESGDLLEAMTRVPELAEKYVGRIKLIYIDPPFNTAQTFASYEDNLEHSIWLTMMRDRLIHMKKLLADDGSIWVHLDDVEVHRMRLLLDEIFGSGNFIADVVWESSPGTKGKAAFSASHNSIVVYAKNKASWSLVRNLMPRSASQLARFANPDNDPRGPWRQGADGTAKSGGEDARWPITLPSGRVVKPSRGRYWAFSKDTFDWALAENRVYFGATGNGLPIIKTYFSEVQSGTTPSTWWSSDDVGSNQEGKRDHLNKMFPDNEPFSTPKPERLLERILHIGSNRGDIVLDVFGGSGTTAAVAQKMGRRWVTCELLESTFDTFTRPRLEKVVNDQDSGGITRTKGERVAADGGALPEGVSPDDAAKFTSVLNKMLKELDESGSEADLDDGSRPDEDDEPLGKSAAVKALKVAAKTKRTKDVINWRGGGGFQVAHLSPACFDYDPTLDRVMLTDAATGSNLVASVAANLGFRLLDGKASIFDGRRGNAMLKVVEGAATIEIVDWLTSQVTAGETVVLAATSVMDGAREHLRRSCKGSRVIAIPDDLFRYSEGGDL